MLETAVQENNKGVLLHFTPLQLIISLKQHDAECFNANVDASTVRNPI